MANEQIIEEVVNIPPPLGLKIIGGVLYQLILANDENGSSKPTWTVVPTETI